MEKSSTAESRHKIKLPSLAFVLCLVIASGIWLFANLSKEYSRTLTYTVSCEDLPKGKQLVGLSDSTLHLLFTARGFAFLSRKYSEDQRHITLSLSALVPQGSKRNVYTLNRQMLTGYIRAQDGFETGFTEVSTPESITVYLK